MNITEAEAQVRTLAESLPVHFANEVVVVLGPSETNSYEVVYADPFDETDWTHATYEEGAELHNEARLAPALIGGNGENPWVTPVAADLESMAAEAAVLEAKRQAEMESFLAELFGGIGTILDDSEFDPDWDTDDDWDYLQ